MVGITLALLGCLVFAMLHYLRTASVATNGVEGHPDSAPIDADAAQKQVMTLKIEVTD